MIVIKDLLVFSQETLLFFIESLLLKEKNVFLLGGKTNYERSIFLQVLANLYQKFAGHVIIDEIIIERYSSRDFCKKIQYADQHGVLFSNMTIWGQFTYILSEYQIDFDIITNIINYHFEKVGLLETLHYYPSELSSSQKIIISVMQKIIIEPKYLLLDNPTEFLNRDEKMMLLYYLLDFKKKGNTLIINSDDEQLKSYFYEKEIILL